MHFPLRAPPKWSAEPPEHDALRRLTSGTALHLSVLAESVIRAWVEELLLSGEGVGKRRCALLRRELQSVAVQGGGGVGTASTKKTPPPRRSTWNGYATLQNQLVTDTGSVLMGIATPRRRRGSEIGGETPPSPPSQGCVTGVGGRCDGGRAPCDRGTERRVTHVTGVAEAERCGAEELDHQPEDLSPALCTRLHNLNADNYIVL